MESKLYEEIALLDHIYELSFSRTATTNGETKALVYIENAIRNENLKPTIEFFDWTGPKRALMRLFYVIFIIYFVLHIQTILILVIFFAIKYLFPKLRKYSLIQKEESRNIYTQISAQNKKDKEKRPVIFLCAHYDSFSAAAPYRLQNILFFIFRMIIIPYFTILIFTSILVIANVFSLYVYVEESLQTFILLTTFIEFGIIILIFLLIYDNKKSKGSIDNASGVSILLELMKILKRNPPKNYDVIFLWSGAEEWGLVGANRFLKKHRERFEEIYDLDKSYAINVDMVGSYIGLLNKTGIFNKKLNRNLNDIIIASALKNKIPIVSYNRLIRPGTDHISFKKFAKKTKSKLQVACFHSSKDSKFIHSSKDTPKRIYLKNLSGCLEICYDTLKAIDSI
ncbi:MAG: M28 family metallopeptidase [Candidatus Heimdallarchaeota archaeon]